VKDDSHLSRVRKLLPNAQVDTPAEGMDITDAMDVGIMVADITEVDVTAQVSNHQAKAIHKAIHRAPRKVK
jgi:hypothetical protein